MILQHCFHIYLVTINSAITGQTHQTRTGIRLMHMNQGSGKQAQ